jgi:hypothetical protein
MLVTEAPATILNGGEQTLDGVTTGFILGSEASAETLQLLRTFPDTVIQVPFEQVSVEAGFNCRNFNTAAAQSHVSEIAGSIAVRSVETPIFVRIEGNRVIVVDGEVRTRAVYKNNDDGKAVPAIPCLLSPTGDDPVARVEDQITKNSGMQFTMTEQVAVINKLLTFGYNKQQILDRLGFSRTMFSRLMILADAPTDVFTAASEGRISPSSVVQLMSSHREASPDEISGYIKKAIKKAEKDAAEAAAAGKTELKGAAVQAKSSDIAAVLGEDEDGVKVPLYSKNSFQGALKLLQHIYNALDRRVSDKERETLQQGIMNFCESINVDITQELEAPRAPLSEEEKAERAAAREAEKAQTDAERAAKKAAVDAAKARAAEILAAAGIKPRERKPKAATAENGTQEATAEAAS